MKARTIMVLGTASHVGKSMLVAALCRIFKNEGLSVAPFKAQNMSLNSYVTPDGGEIGRAQAVQAEAAGLSPAVEMNPILLKPEANSRSQIVILGRPRKTVAAKDYYTLKSELWPVVTGALDKLRSKYDVVVIEGAGSPAEINLMSQEIVNMSVARYCRCPCLLVGDIDRGGVFASLLGTLWLLPPEDRALIKALVINKFRGDVRLLKPGIDFLEEKAGIPVAGIIPYYEGINIAEEDSVGLEKSQSEATDFQVDVAVVRLPHISNFDDFDPLDKDEGVRLRYVNSVANMGQPDLIIIPGSKTTIADLDWLESSGLADSISELYQQGAFVVGICGGYQMLGKEIEDPHHVESPDSSRRGLGLLPVSTVFLATKDTHQIKGEVVCGQGLLRQAKGLTLEGYEIHMGRTKTDSEKPFRLLERSGKPCRRLDGCLDSSGRVLGTYIHGLFHNRELRRAILRHISASKHRTINFAEHGRSQDLDKLAAVFSQNLDMKLVHHLIGLKGKQHD